MMESDKKVHNTVKVSMTYLMYLLIALLFVSSSFFAHRSYYPLVIFNLLCVSVTFFFVFTFKDKIQERPMRSLLSMELLFLLICLGTAAILIMTVDAPETPISQHDGGDL